MTGFLNVGCKNAISVMGEILEIPLRVQIRVGTYIYRYILYSVNLRFPPGFEEGHFHGFSSGETKILMNRTHTARKKKMKTNKLLFSLRIMSSNRS